MTPVRPGALVVSAAAPAPTSAPAPATSKTAPEPLASSHTRPGAYTAYTRAIGDRPAWNQANAVGGNDDKMDQGTSTLLLQAELVASQPFEGGVETGETPLSTPLERDVAAVVEVNSAVIAVAAPIDTKRKYYYMAGFLLVVAAFATVLGVVLPQEKEELPEKPRGPPPPDEVLATVPATICYERNPGAGWSVACSVNATSERGGGVTNLVAQACLDRFPNADMAIYNAGNVRGDIVEGNFTFGDLLDLLPYNENTLILLEMRGSEIKLVLEQALDFVFAKPNEQMTGAYPYAAGLKFAVNVTAEFGNRLSDMQVKEREKGTWESLGSTFVYAVVANSYIARGQDGYLLFDEILEVEDTKMLTSKTFLEYAVAQEVLLDPPLEDYSTISYIPP
jgi:hypothetical protein